MLWEALFSLDDAAHYVSFEALAFLLEGLVLLWIGKLIRDGLTPRDLNAELTTKDNKAVAISYTGYLMAQAIIILGVLEGPSDSFVKDLINVGIWSLAGILLLNLALWVNRKLMLRHFCADKEVYDDQNCGAGAVEAGAAIGTGFLIRAVVGSDGMGIDWQHDVITAAIFFVVGQLGFLLFAFVYQRMASYDLHKEIESDNVAAGVGFGMTLAAVGVLMSNTIHSTPSLVAFGVWFFNGVVLLVLTRMLVDKFILPGHKLDSEISQDRNWGAALIEGGAAFMVAFLVNAAFA